MAYSATSLRAPVNTTDMLYLDGVRRPPYSALTPETQERVMADCVRRIARYERMARQAAQMRDNSLEVV